MLVQRSYRVSQGWAFVVLLSYGVSEEIPEGRLLRLTPVLTGSETLLRCEADVKATLTKVRT